AGAEGFLREALAPCRDGGLALGGREHGPGPAPARTPRHRTLLTRGQLRRHPRLDASLDLHTLPSCLAAGRCLHGGGLSRDHPFEIAGEEGERCGLRDLLSVLILLRHHLLLSLPVDDNALERWRGVSRTSVSLWLAPMSEVRCFPHTASPVWGRAEVGGRPPGPRPVQYCSKSHASLGRCAMGGGP